MRVVVQSPWLLCCVGGLFGSVTLLHILKNDVIDSCKYGITWRDLIGTMQHVVDSEPSVFRLTNATPGGDIMKWKKWKKSVNINLTLGLWFYLKGKQKLFYICCVMVDSIWTNLCLLSRLSQPEPVASSGSGPPLTGDREWGFQSQTLRWWTFNLTSSDFWMYPWTAAGE